MVFEKLTAKDLDMIDSYRQAYAALSDFPITNEKYEDISFVLREWESAKSQYLFKMFGEKLILTKPVEYTKPQEDIVAEFYDMLDDEWEYGRKNRPYNIFHNNYLNWLNKDFPYRDFHDWDSLTPETRNERRSANRLHDSLRELISPYYLASNKVVCAFSVPLPDGKIMKVSEGSRVIRVLSKLAKYFNIEGFEDFRIGHSQVLNQKKISGILTLSIHPLDYMTMSDNNCGWTSCMSWRDEGCYRQGTVEMMNSPTVIVAYLNAKENMDDYCWTEDQTWSNKKWRKLFVVDRNCIASVKDYPYYSEDLTKQVMNWLKELAQTNLGWTYEDKMKTWDGKSSVYFDSSDSYVSLDFYTYSMYSDFGSATTHFLYLNDGFDDEAFCIPVAYSGDSECMVCGQLCSADGMNDNNYLACDECCEIHYCDECGDATNECFEVDDEILCEYCYDNQTSRCIISGEIHLESRMEIIEIFPDSFREKPCEGSRFRIKCCSYFNEFSEEDFANEFLIPGAEIHKIVYNKPWGLAYKGVFFSDINVRLKEELYLTDFTSADYEKFIG